MNQWKPNTTTLLLLIVLLCCGSMWWKVHALSEGITRVINHYEAPMQTATSTVTNSDGVTVTITTTRKIDEGETDAAFIARHLALVEAARNS